MRHVAAYLLAVLGGNESPSSKDIKDILSSVGVEADDKSLETVINSLKGKDIEELLKEGTEKLVREREKCENCKKKIILKNPLFSGLDAGWWRCPRRFWRWRRWSCSRR